LTRSKHVTIAVSGSNPGARKLVDSLSNKYQVIEITGAPSTPCGHVDSAENNTIKLLNFCDFGHAVHLRLRVNEAIQERFCDLLISIGPEGCAVKKLLGYEVSAVNEITPPRQGATSANYRPIQSFGRVLVSAENNNPDEIIGWIEDSMAAMPNDGHYGFGLIRRDVNLP